MSASSSSSAVGPLDLPLSDEVAERERAPGELVEVGAGDARDAVLDDDQRAAEAAPVAVDDHLVHLVVVADVELVRLVAEGRGERPRPPALADLPHQLEGLGVETDQVPVDVDARRALPAGRRRLLEDLRTDLAGVQVPKDEGDLLLVGAFAHVHAESVVLDESAVLPLGRLVGAEAAPLRRVQVARLEVRLAPRERARDAAKVADGRHVARPVEHLAHPGAPADPVAGREGVNQPLRQ